MKEKQEEEKPNVSQHYKEILRALNKPSHFLSSPYFLGITPYPKQSELFDKFYLGNYREFVLVAGMRSGKSLLASAFAMYEAFDILTRTNPQKDFHIHKSSNIFIILVATSDEQAKDALFSHVEWWAKTSPFFQSQNPKILQNQIKFPSKRLIIFSGSSSSASMVGRSAKAVIFDELARFEQTEGKRGAWAVYAALSKATQTFGEEGHRFITSSILHQDDILMQLYSKGKTKTNTLTSMYPTWEFNPNIKFDDLQSEMITDPVAFWRDYGCKPISSQYPYFNLDHVNFDGRPNILELIREGVNVEPINTTYAIGLDPSLKHDAFGVSLMHKEGDTFILDGLVKFEPKTQEISPLAVKEFLSKVIEKFPVYYIATDTNMYPELMEYLRSRGLKVRVKICQKDVYDNFREKLYLGKIKLIPNEDLESEMLNLQVVNPKRVDHPRGGSKDLIDAVVQAFEVLEGKIRKPKYNLLSVINW